MPDTDDKLTPADPSEVVTALSLGLTSGRQLARYQAAETMAKIVAERLVAHLEEIRLPGDEADTARRNIAATVRRRLAAYD